MRYAWRRMVVRDPYLTDATRRVLLELESYANPDGSNARPGIKRLSEVLLTGDRHLSERTVRRALETGVERGFLECVAKGHSGRMRNAADVYNLRIESQPPDIQMSTDAESTTGHPDVHRSASTSGHSEPTTGHLAATTGHPDVHPPVPYTSPSTPEKSGGGRVALEEDGPRSRPVPVDAWKMVRGIVPEQHPQAVRTELALQAGQLMKSGTDSGLVESALTLWMTKPHLGPRALPSLVSEVIKGQTPRNINPQPGPATTKALGWLATAEGIVAARNELSTADKRVLQAQAVTERFATGDIPNIFGELP